MRARLGRSRRDARAAIAAACVGLAAVPAARALAGPASDAADGPTRRAVTAGPVQVGSPMVSFGGPALGGGVFTWSRFMSEQRPRALVVSLFGTWCGSCERRLPDIGSVVASRRGRGVRLVLVDVESPVPPDLAAYLETHGIDITATDVPVVLDLFEAISGKRLAVNALPRTYVVDGTGIVSAIFTHEGDDFRNALAQAVDAALAGARDVPTEPDRP